MNLLCVTQCYYLVIICNFITMVWCQMLAGYTYDNDVRYYGVCMCVQVVSVWWLRCSVGALVHTRPSAAAAGGSSPQQHRAALHSAPSALQCLLRRQGSASIHSTLNRCLCLLLLTIKLNTSVALKYHKCSVQMEFCLATLRLWAMNYYHRYYP